MHIRSFTLRRLRPLAVGLLWLALGAAWLWALLAIWYFDPLSTWVRVPVAIVAVAATIWCCLRCRYRVAVRVIAIGVLGVCLIWSLQKPSNERAWAGDQARMPRAVFDRDVVTIENLRHATYRSVDDYDVSWCRRQYDLAAIERVDFVVEPIATWRGPAHTFLTFGFDDGRHVAVSAEIRKEVGESFSPLKGLFRHYEVMYVVGDERDLIGLRAHIRKNRVYLYPINATKEQVRTLFVAMLGRANRLAERPEFYNTLTNTCTTNIVRHLEDLTGEGLPIDLRILFPGYSDTLAFELGLIDVESSSAGSFERDREQFCVVGGTDLSADDRAWSREIRQGGE